MTNFTDISSFESFSENEKSIVIENIKLYYNFFEIANELGLLGVEDELHKSDRFFAKFLLGLIIDATDGNFVFEIARNIINSSKVSDFEKNMMNIDMIVTLCMHDGICASDFLNLIFEILKINDSKLKLSFNNVQPQTKETNIIMKEIFDFSSYEEPIFIFNEIPDYSQLSTEEKESIFSLMTDCYKISKICRNDGLTGLVSEIKSMKDSDFRNLLNVICDGGNWETIKQYTNNLIQSEKNSSFQKLYNMILTIGVVSLKSGLNPRTLKCRQLSLLGIQPDFFKDSFIKKLFADESDLLTVSSVLCGKI